MPFILDCNKTSTEQTFNERRPHGRGNPQDRLGLQKRCALGEPCPRRTDGALNPRRQRPGLRSRSGRLSAPRNLLLHEPAARWGLSVSGAVCNSPRSVSGFLQAARATSCTPPNFGFPLTNFLDLLRLLSSSPERTLSESSLQPVPPAILPPAWLRNPGRGEGGWGGLAAINPRPPALPATSPPANPQPEVSSWGALRRRAAAEGAWARSGRPSPAVPGPFGSACGRTRRGPAALPGLLGRRAGGRQAWGADQSPGMTPRPRARTSRPQSLPLRRP